MNKEQQGLLDEVYENYWNSHPDEEKTFQYEGHNIETRRMTKDEFVDMVKTDKECGRRWGLKIEERELSLEERFNIKYPGGKFSIFQENYPNTHKRNNPNDLLDAFDIPTKLITITYNDKTIQSYE